MHSEIYINCRHLNFDVWKYSILIWRLQNKLFNSTALSVAEEDNLSAGFVFRFKCFTMSERMFD